MHVDELETPVPIVDMDRMEANIARLQTYLDEHNIANRPHIKPQNPCYRQNADRFRCNWHYLSKGQRSGGHGKRGFHRHFDSIQYHRRE